MNSYPDNSKIWNVFIEINYLLFDNKYKDYPDLAELSLGLAKMPA